MKYFKLPIYALAAVMMTAPTLANAWDWNDDDDDELELDEAYLYFELNDTDGDLGIHGKADGDGWKRMKIEAPNDRTLLNIIVRSKLRRQGLTELFFESTEPTFDDLDPDDFFARCPEGEYEWEGKTLDGKEIEGEMYLSQRIPAAPVVASVGAGSAPEIEDGELGCWGFPGDGDVEIAWDPVTLTHASLGSDTNADLGDNSVIYYEFVVEVDDTEFKSTALVPPDVNAWTVSEDFRDFVEDILVEDEDEVDENGDPVMVPVEEIKFEIIVRVESGNHLDDDGEEIESKPGNQSAVESCFLIVEEDEEEEEDEV